MNLSQAVFLINDNVKAIKAIYDDGKAEETFKTLDASLKKDDLILVQTTTRHGMTVVKVTEVDVAIDFDSPTVLRWAVGKVNREKLDQLLSQEAAAVEVVRNAEVNQKKKAMRSLIFADHADEIAKLPLATATDNSVISPTGEKVCTVS